MKHDPKSKYSARSSGELSINNTPSKSNNYKFHTALTSKTPVRVGEMEFSSLLLTENPELVNRYLAQTSNNPEERNNFNKHLLTDDPFNIDKIERIGSQSITSQIVKTQFKTIGLENRLEAEEQPDVTLEEVEEIYKDELLNDEE